MYDECIYLKVENVYYVLNYMEYVILKFIRKIINCLGGNEILKFVVFRKKISIFLFLENYFI